MLTQPYVIDIPVPIIQYGYFLYVWEVTIAEDNLILYVGRTGDDVYVTANPPVVRIGQHLDQGPGASLINNCVNVREAAGLRIVIHGPIFPPPEGDAEAHRVRLNAMRPLERALRDALKHNGYTIVGTHPNNWDLCHRCWQGVQEAFGHQHFNLDAAPPGRDDRPDNPCYLHA